MRTTDAAGVPRLLLAVVLLAAFAGIVQAQAPLSLDAAVETALRTHPLLEAGAGRVSAAESDLVAAGLRLKTGVPGDAEPERRQSGGHVRLRFAVGGDRGQADAAPGSSYRSCRPSMR